MVVVAFPPPRSRLRHLPIRPTYIPPRPHVKLLPYSSSTLLPHPGTPEKPQPTFARIFQCCSANQDLRSGRQAHARMITSGFTPTIFVANCLIHMYVRCSSLDGARKVLDAMPERDIVSWNALLSGFVQSSTMTMAWLLFNSMEDRDTVSWNSLISGYLQSGDPKESISVFSEMGHRGVCPDRATFAVVLKSCSALKDYNVGVQAHALLVKMHLDVDVVTGSALVDMYAKCNRLDESLVFFDRMLERNRVSWCALIGGCVQNEEYLLALEFFVLMQRDGFVVGQSAYASAFRSCSVLVSVRIGWQLHGHALKGGFNSDVIVGTAILDMYAKCDCLDDAQRAFDGLLNPSLQSWNAIIVGFSRNNQGILAMQLFGLMHRSCVGVDEISLSALFSASAEVKAYLQGSQAHGLSIKSSLIFNICVKNSILDMYGKCGALEEVQTIFDEMDFKDVVSWNAVIAALEQNGLFQETFLHFDHMLMHGMDPDEFTYGSVLKACAGLRSLILGKKIHDMIIKCGLYLQSFIVSALIDMYCKCGVIEEAVKLHERLGEPTVVSWNAIISGFSLHKQSEEAQKFFFKMLDAGLKPDNYTYATVLDTCSNLVMICLGKQVHVQIIKEKLQKDVYVSSALVDMYAKCGNLQDSLLMFEKMVERDFVSWNAVICGYSHHGFAEQALEMFESMQKENVTPNAATFLAVLRACAHVGYVDEGKQYFNLMTSKYGLVPQLEHYSCIVDLIGHTKGLDEALKVIDGMPYEADAVLWRTVLNICNMHGNVEVAELAASKILSLDPEDSAAYVLLSNVYSGAKRWREVSELRIMMRHHRLKKEPGCSWIELQSEMHAFLVGDKAHPECKEIYERLDDLIIEMMSVGYVPDWDFSLDAEEGRADDQELAMVDIWLVSPTPLPDPTLSSVSETDELKDMASLRKAV